MMRTITVFDRANKETRTIVLTITCPDVDVPGILAGLIDKKYTVFEVK